MSARFTAAAALLGFPVHDPWFFEAHHGDPVLRELANRIELIEAPDDSVFVAITCQDRTELLFDAIDNNLLFPDFNAGQTRFLQTHDSSGAVNVFKTIANICKLEKLSNVSDMI